MRSKFLPLTRRVYYTKDLQSLVQQVRTFSRIPNDISPVSKSAIEQKVFLGPRDFRTPLPGNVGTAQYFLTFTTTVPVHRPEPNSSQISFLAESLSVDPILNETQKNVLSQLLSTAFEEPPKSSPPVNHVLECLAQDCPSLLKKDLVCLFTSRDLNSEDLTVLTLSQKTKHDMSIWSQDMEEERDELMTQFVTAAQEICDFLTRQGYWADFIDPSSGSPFNSTQTTATFLETDERYRYLGFNIEDLGCCKVISHKLWGSHAFVGSLFTNAPLESPEVQDILEKHSSN